MKIGTEDITNPYVGTEPVNKVMLGDMLVWERVAPVDPTLFRFTIDFGTTSGRVTLYIINGDDMFYERTPGGTPFAFSSGEVNVNLDGYAEVVFYGKNLTEIDLRGNAGTKFKSIYIDTLGDSLTSLRLALHQQAEMTSVEFSSTDVTKNITNMFQLFSSCTRLTTITNLNTENVLDAFEIFRSCEKLTTIGYCDFRKVSSLHFAFYYCRVLEEVHIDTSNILTSVNQTFNGCYILTDICGTLDFSSATILSSTFANCNVLASPASTGTPVRDGNNALNGVWTNPGACT